MSKKQEELIPNEVIKAIESAAKTLGVAVTELWSIYIRQYVVRGVTEAFTGLVLTVASFVLWSSIGLFGLIPLSFGLMFIYGSILLLGNPKYYAIEDVIRKVKDARPEKNRRGYYL